MDTISIHEAGHTVAHYRLGLEIDGVSIIPDQLTSGRIFGPGADHCMSKDAARSQVLAYLAGYAALVAFGESEEVSLRGTESDIYCAESLISFWELQDIEKWKSEAVTMMSSPENKKAVLRVAQELTLRGTLPMDMAFVLIEIADGEATEGDFLSYLRRSGLT